MSDLAVLRHAVEEIASNQGQTSRDIASLQAAQQNVSQQISSLARATSTRAAAQKSAAKKPHPQAPNQSTAPVPGAVPPQAPAPAANAVRFAVAHKLTSLGADDVRVLVSFVVQGAHGRPDYTDAMFNLALRTRKTSARRSAG